jgi:hypothetical protein
VKASRTRWVTDALAGDERARQGDEEYEKRFGHRAYDASDKECRLKVQCVQFVLGSPLHLQSGKSPRRSAIRGQSGAGGIRRIVLLRALPSQANTLIRMRDG